jgi:hypothetical protein
VTYSTSSSFLSAPGTNQRAWADAIRTHNKDQADAIAAAYFTLGAQIGINADLAIAQACHESGWFTSGHWVNQFNPCGLGVTSDTARGATYTNIGDGIKAHYEHLVCYVMPNDPPIIARWGMLDTRHLFHDGMPRVSDLVRPNRKWAVPGDGYADAIVRIANQVATGGGTVVGSTPTEADLGYPGHVHYASGSGEAMDISAVRWFVIHDTEGYFAGDEQTLSGQISAHLLIAKTGEWRFMVPLASAAYATGNIDVNRQSISVEQSGFADAHDGGYTDAQYRCAAAFYRWCVANGMVNVPAVYVGKRDADGGPEPDVAGILGHQDVPRDDGKPGWGGNYGHQDPGPTYDWNKLIAYIGNAPPPPPPTPAFVIDGHDVGEGFYNDLTLMGDNRLRWFGSVLNDQHDAYLIEPANEAQLAKGLHEVAHSVVAVDGDRDTLIWDRGRTPAPWDVRFPSRTQRVVPVDDIVLQAILTDMRLVNEPI